MTRSHAGDRKKILVLAPFFSGEGTWIDDFCERPDFSFQKLPYPHRAKPWHGRGAVTPLAEWLAHFKYVRGALRLKPDCIVTSFPQLALVAAALLLGRRRGVGLVAWNFNLGSIGNRWKGRLAGLLLRRVNRFVVHARSEVSSYARWLAVEQERFCFVPLQRGKVIASGPANVVEGPYIVSMGSANRDYLTLVEAVLGTGITTVVIAKRELIDALPDHPQLLKLSGLTQAECNDILAGARVNVVPLRATPTAAGQVTFITSMRMGIATVATHCVGTEDYIEDGVTGFLVPPGDVEMLRRRITALWNDVGLRNSIGSAGGAHAELHFSDEAAGRYLSGVIDAALN